MQNPIPGHASSVDWYTPPDHVAKKLISHAVRNIPHKERLMDLLYPKKTYLKQMPDHEYNSGGKLQWMFQN
jgi:hypothetical protein